MIGHLQRSKAKRAVQLFDMIETIYSKKIAKAVNRHCGDRGNTMPVFVEINCGRESNKSCVMPEDIDELVKEISPLPNLRIQELTTMESCFGNLEDARSYLKVIKTTFDLLKKAGFPNVDMQYLSNDMSNRY
jgi:uncharacterized pyridoxal phosphate-containing UPF0001 family protein